MQHDITKPKLISLDSAPSQSGQLHFFNGQLPFLIKRLFWISEVPEGAVRGVHAHRQESQIVVCISGKVSAKLESLSGEIVDVTLDSPAKALLIPPMFWTEFTFEEKSVLLGAGDMDFSEKDYIRKKDEFEQNQVSQKMSFEM